MTEEFELTPPLEDLTSLGETGEFFASLIDLMQGTLKKQGLDEDKASRLVSKCVCEIAEAYSGETFYVTRKPAIFIKHLAMYADSKRMPHYDVDRKYNVSRGYCSAVVRQIDYIRHHREQLKFDF